MKKLFALLLVVPLLAATVFAQSLWGESKVGMTPEEVLAAIENSQRVSDGDPLTSGAVELVKVEGITVTGRTLNARFYFENDGLVQVTLSVEKEHLTSDIVTAGIFNDLLAALRSRYGAENLHNIDKNSMSTFSKAEWIVDGTNIGLHQVSVLGTHIVNIVYNTRLSDGIDNL